MIHLRFLGFTLVLLRVLITEHHVGAEARNIPNTQIGVPILVLVNETLQSARCSPFGLAPRPPTAPFQECQPLWI